MNLYLTQDRIGTPTGGGAVTFHEYTALAGMGRPTNPIDNARIPLTLNPFENDRLIADFVARMTMSEPVELAHIYSGCFTETVRVLKKRGAKVCYTAAAHSITESRREFQELGIEFDFPHLTDPVLWEKYVGGYRDADLVICPSQISKACMESYGCKNVIVIPHGCESRETIAPMPKEFTVGYLGQSGPDKGLRYLFEAWARLGLKDATLLLAGNNIPLGMQLWRNHGGSRIHFMGFVKDVSEFYDRISVYVQPSATEGFGIEVLEAMAHGRPVICSDGVGAVDVLNEHGLADWAFKSRDVAGLMKLISKRPTNGAACRQIARGYTWDSVRERYQRAWGAL